MARILFHAREGGISHLANDRRAAAVQADRTASYATIAVVEGAT
jgi:hypothetical protein